LLSHDYNLVKECKTIQEVSAALTKYLKSGVVSHFAPQKGLYGAKITVLAANRIKYRDVAENLLGIRIKQDF